MNIAITGGTGFVGAHLARALISRGHYCKLLARGLNHRDEAIRKLPNASFIPMSLTDDKKLFQAFNGCDGIAHLAGINRELSKDDFYKVHVESTIHIIHAARKANVKKIVLMSFLKARPKCFSKYHESKWEAEELIRNCELDYTILKPGIIYGKGDHMLTHIKMVLDTIPLFGSVGVLPRKIRPVAIEDVVEILLAALIEGQMSRQTIPLLGPEELTLGKCVQRVAKVMKKPAIVFPMPTLAHLAMASAMEKVSSQPIVSVAQVRMLAEGMDKPIKPFDEIPADLKPQRLFNEEQIIRGLG